MEDVLKVTNERGKRYGDFRGHALATQRLKETIDAALDSNENFSAMPLGDQMIVREGLAMIAHKIGRIVNGDPTYDDSWLDIEGYSKITRERVCK
jgi:hypothetical protein